jgi:hypothetical protein
VPIWCAGHFPSQDGPSHLDTAHVLLRYHDAGTPAFAQLYELRVKLGPNILLSLVLAGLMVVFDPSVAERLLVSGYVLLFALSFRAAIRAVAPESRWMATFALPLAYNAPLHMGFYSFSLSVALFPLAIAAWLRGHPAWTARRDSPARKRLQPTG